MSFGKTVLATVIGGLIVALVGGAIVSWLRSNISGAIKAPAATPPQAEYEPAPAATTSPV